MIRFTKWPPWVAVLAGAFMLGTASPARADIELQLQENSGTVNTYDVSANTGPVLFSGDFGASGASGTGFTNGTLVSGATGTGAGYGDFTLALSYGKSNSPGGSPALTSLANVDITNNTGSQQTLTITVSAQGFTIPNGSSLAVTDTVSGSSAFGVLGGTAQGFADKTDALFGQGFASSLLSIPATDGGSSFAVNGGASGFSPSGATYSLTFTETITLSAGGSVTLTGGNVEVVPEPASMMAALSAVPFLAVGAWLRRRKQVAVA